MKKVLSIVAILAITRLAPGAQEVPPAGAENPGDAAPAVVEEPPVMMLRMRSGEVLWGSIVAHQPEQISFKRLDNGGTVKLPWSFLDPDEEQALRMRFGYVDLVAEEVMIDADQILLTTGQEIVGLIERRNEEYLFVKRAESSVPVAKRLVAGASRVRIPALDVYTKDELYQRRRNELQGQLILAGEQGATAHLELARFCERLLDYRHAVHHYQQVRLLDAQLEAEVVGVALLRTGAKAELQEQVDILHEIDLWRARRLYDKALELHAEFPERFPDSPLLEDWNKLRDKIARYQEADLRKQVVTSWHRKTVALAREAARGMETLEQVLAYCEEAYTLDLVAAVQLDLQKIAPEITLEEVAALWADRKGGSFRQATYSLGTWLLGEEKARAELDEDDEDEAQSEGRGSISEERRRFDERMRRYLENQKVARAHKGRGGLEDEAPEEFWRQWKSASRAQWILAYFVENSGHFQVARVQFANCRDCGGSGARTVVFTGGAIAGATAGERLVPCPTCHTIGITRRVRYR